MNLSDIEYKISKTTEYRYYKFVCNDSVNNCNTCLSLAGKVFRDDDSTKPELPIHKNCKCKYDEIDTDYQIVNELNKITANLQTNKDILPDMADQLALQIIYAKLENSRIDISDVFMLFNGEYFISSDGKFAVPAVSGKPIDVKTIRINAIFPELYSENKVYTFDYSYDRQGAKNVGGIPQGLYYINVKEQRSALTSPYSHVIKSRGWGRYSWSLHATPDTVTRGRGGFFIHGGDEYGSAGCIDLHQQDIIFHKYLFSQNRKTIYVYVRYNKSQAAVSDKKTIFHNL